MIDRSKQVISDADTIVCLLDKAIIESLNSHDTYKAKSLFHQLWKSKFTKSSIKHSAIKMLQKVLDKVYRNQIENSDLAQEIDEFIRENNNKNCNTIEAFTIDTIEPFFAEGVNCNLLQPDGTGWQKGKLRMCFEFIPEKHEPVVTQEKTVETHRSPLDEIRQLSNELTSGISIEQN